MDDRIGLSPGSRLCVVNGPNSPAVHEFGGTNFSRRDCRMMTARDWNVRMTWNKLHELRKIVFNNDRIQVQVSHCTKSISLDDDDDDSAHK